MKIKMDVELLNEKCVNCKDLELDVMTTMSTGIEAYSDNPDEAKNASVCTNELRCAHFQECKWRYEHIMKEDKPEEKKAEIKVLAKLAEKKAPAKKPAAKKEPVKKAPAVTPAKKESAKKPAPAKKTTTKAKAAAKK